MMNKIFLYLKNFDWVLFFPVLLLISFGLIEIYSVALGQGGSDFVNFKKQIVFAIIGLILLFFFSFLDYHVLRNYNIYIYLLGIGALIAVLLFGQTIRGTRGWFYVGGLGVQPVEFIKIILIIFLARFFSVISLRTRPLKYLIISGLGAFVLVGLVLTQPDFGSAFLLIAVWFIMVILAGFKKKYFVVIGFMFAIVFSLSWLFFFEDYQKQRIMTFINPSFDPLNQGYNISQAIIAVGAGGLKGRGIGFGSQSQLKFLPEAQNDFIFAVIAEELGFLGVSMLLLFYGIFFYRCLTNIKKISDDFGIFFVLGVAGLIFVEMFINIGMNIGILPVVGISLPFVSYGGSAMIASMVMVGIVQSVIIRSKINY